MMSKSKTLSKLARFCIAGTVVLAMSMPAQASDVIGISSLQDIMKIGVDSDYPLNGHYELTNDIDASASRTMNDGRGWTPIGNLTGQVIYCRDADIPDYPHILNCGEAISHVGDFTGTFDGKGQKITGLYINRSYSVPFGMSMTPLYVAGGLFGSIYGATVKNLFLETDTITVGGYYGITAGTLASVSRNSTITNVHSTGTIHSTAHRKVPAQHETLPDVRIGGLVGLSSEGSVISGSSFTGTVISQLGFTPAVTLPNYMRVGGLVGNNYGGTITESQAAATVTGHITFVGGLVGENDLGGSITNSEATATIGGSGRFAGGLVGENKSGTIVGCDASVTWAANANFESKAELVGIGGGNTSVRNYAARGTNKNQFAPTITVRGKTLNVRTSSSTTNLQIRLIDVRGRTLTRFNMTGVNGNFSLSRIPAGRYFVDMRDMDTGRRSTSSVVLR